MFYSLECTKMLPLYVYDIRGWWLVVSGSGAVPVRMYVCMCVPPLVAMPGLRWPWPNNRRANFWPRRTTANEWTKRTNERERWSLTDWCSEEVVATLRTYSKSPQCRMVSSSPPSQASSPSRCTSWLCWLACSTVVVSSRCWQNQDEQNRRTKRLGDVTQ